MIPEAVVAMLACARIGAAHSVVFGGFSADAIATRIQDADAKLVITSDGGYRRGKPSALKPAVDDAVSRVDGSTRCWWSAVPARRSTGPRAATCGGTRSSSGSPPSTCWRLSTPSSRCSSSTPPGPREAEGHPAHRRYLPGAAPTTSSSRPQAGDRRVLVHGRHRLGHRALYITYGPLSNGATQVMYEGAHRTRRTRRFWRSCRSTG